MSLLSDTAYCRRVELALHDAGVEAPVEDAIRLVAWSIKQGNRLPWWKFHKQAILDTEGGYVDVHATIMALTIGLMVRTPGLALADAAQQAGDEFRSSIRRQWDDGEAQVKQPTSLDMLAEREASRRGTAPVEEAERLVYLYTDEPEATAPFDETVMTDPRLIMAWELASEKEREVLRLVAEGVNLNAASELLDGSSSLAHNRMNQYRRKLRKAHVLANGPAG